MKRTATAFLLVAGLGGCVSPDGGSKSTVPPPKKFGAATKPADTAKVATPTGKPVVQASATAPVTADPNVTNAGFARVMGGGDGCATGDCATGDCSTGQCGPTHKLAGHFANKPPHMVPDYGPVANGLSIGTGHAGIFPAPAMGPWGAVAAVGAFGPGSHAPAFCDQRTQIRFVNPAGMKITWLGPNGFTDDTPLEAPARYNFPQGSIYRLKLTGIPNRPGAIFYPTLEVYPATPHTITFLSHGPVPVSFTDEDFDQVRGGNLVTKVIYLPNPTYQDLAAVGGAEEVVSTRLEPGVDPIAEANRRGTILAVVRIGGIDLQDPNTPAMTAPPAMSAPVPAPGMGAPLPTPAPAPFPVPATPPAPSGPATRTPAMPVPSAPTGPAIAMPALLK